MMNDDYTPLNPEGSLWLAMGVDRDAELAMFIRNPKSSDKQTVYLDKATACRLIIRLMSVFNIRLEDL